MDYQDTPIIVNSQIYNQSIKSYIDFIFINSIIQNKLWEEYLCNIICDFIENDTDFLDIGANIGLITLGVNKLLNNKKIKNIHCFECDNHIFSCLQYNTQNFENIKLYNFAVSHKFQLCNITNNAYNRGSNMILKTHDNEKIENVIKHNAYEKYKTFHKYNNNIFYTSISLDEIMFTFLNKISVIKIDVEGFEILVIKGAKNLIKKYKPVIVIEIQDKNFNELNTLLLEYEYFLFKSFNYLIDGIKQENYIYLPNK